MKGLDSILSIFKPIVFAKMCLLNFFQVQTFRPIKIWGISIYIYTHEIFTQ